MLNFLANRERLTLALSIIAAWVISYMVSFYIVVEIMMPPDSFMSVTQTNIRLAISTFILGCLGSVIAVFFTLGFIFFMGIKQSLFGK